MKLFKIVKYIRNINSKQSEKNTIVFQSGPKLTVAEYRIGLFSFIMSKQNDAKLIKMRSQTQTEILQWGGVSFDDNILNGDYNKYIQQLIDNGDVYKCFCDKKRINSLKKYDSYCKSLSDSNVNEKILNKVPFTLRLNIKDQKTSFTDMIYGKINITYEDNEDVVVVDENQEPTQSFKDIIDVFESKIGYHFKDEKFINKTAQETFIYEALNFQQPKYAHIPGLTQGKKEDVPLLKYYKDLGISNETMFKYFSTLGLDEQFLKENELNQNDVQINDIVEKFKISAINVDKIEFKEKELLRKNKQYMQNKLKALDGENKSEITDSFKQILKQQLPEYSQQIDNTDIQNILKIVKQSKFDKYSDLKIFRFLFQSVKQDKNSDNNIINIEINKYDLNKTKMIIGKFYNELQKLKEFTSENINQSCSSILYNNQYIKRQEFYDPLKMILTNEVSSLSLGDICWLLKREKCLNILKKVLNE